MIRSGLVFALLGGVAAPAFAEPKPVQTHEKSCPPADPKKMPIGSLYTIAGNPRSEYQAGLLQPGDYYDDMQVGVRVVRPGDVPSRAIGAYCPVIPRGGAFS